MDTSQRSSRSSSPTEERRFLDSWNPEPLVPDIEIDHHVHALKPHVVTSKPGKYILVDGKECLNLGTHNYLGLADDPRLESESIEAARKYGVGSCGPRAFYGTMDIHLKLEEEIASFLNVQEAVLYSYGFSTVASAIPAYAKSTDTVFVDEVCNFAIQQGLNVSRCRIIRFKHNDVKDLEDKIENLRKEQIKASGKVKNSRSFLIVEGLYVKTGDICPLKELIEIKKRFKIRLFIDESWSFGVLGSEGKGVTQHFNVDINDVDLIMASLENALCAFGGFCAGSSFVIDHQRLAGTGYCFSASLPPLQVQAALTSLNIIRDNSSMIVRAQEIYTYAHNKLLGLAHLQNISDPDSPIKILTLKLRDSQNGAHCCSNEDDLILLNNVCENLLRYENIAITVARYLEDDEMVRPNPSIRLVINAQLTRGDIDRVIVALNRFTTLANVCCQVLDDEIHLKP